MARRTAPADPPADETPDDSGHAAPTTTVDPVAESTAGSPPPRRPPPSPASSPGSGSIEITRRPGWLGGVCAGIAERIGIDPLIVRGIVVVLAVVGAPVALLYAVAWFLLPDESGIIHAQELGHGRVTRALPGIVAIFLLSFLPLTQGLWYTGALYWSNLDWGGAVARAVWTGVVLVAGIVLVVWLARRASAEVPTTPATTDDRPETVPSFPASSDAEADAEAEIAAAVAAAVAGAPIAAPGEPPAPPADASAEELAAWKQSQDAWQQQRAAWAAEQKRSERDRRQAEAGIRALAAAEAARERARIRKLTRPRARAGVVFLVLGLALVASAIAALRRVPGTCHPRSRVAHRGGRARARARPRHDRGRPGAPPQRRARVLLDPLGARARGRAGGSHRSRPAAAGPLLRHQRHNGWPLRTVRRHDDDVRERPRRRAGHRRPVELAGSVQVQLEEGATLRVELTSDGDQWVTVEEQRYDGGGRVATYRTTDGRLQFTAGDGDPDVLLRVWLGRSAYLNVQSWTDAEPSLTLDPAPDELHAWNADGSGVDLLEPTPIPVPTPDPGTTDEGGN